jgi:TIR domain
MYFISYSSRDGSGFAARLVQALASGPVPMEAWTADSIPAAGSDWETSIQDAIGTCEALLFVATPDILDEKAFNQELRFALELAKPVAVLRYRGRWMRRLSDQELLPRYQPWS